MYRCNWYAFKSIKWRKKEKVSRYFVEIMLLAEMRKFSAGAAKCLYFHTSFFFYHQRKKLVFLFSFCPIPKLCTFNPWLINRESHFESTAYRYQTRYNYCIAGTLKYHFLGCQNLLIYGAPRTRTTKINNYIGNTIGSEQNAGSNIVQRNGQNLNRRKWQLPETRLAHLFWKQIRFFLNESSQIFHLIL